MSCNLNKCCNEAETEDGFCLLHGYYSSTDNEYIIKHIQNYLDDIEGTSCNKNKIKKIINLWYYLTYKKDFILENNNFYKSILNKAEELKNDLMEENLTTELQKFNNLHDQIKSFKN